MRSDPGIEDAEHTRRRSATLVLGGLIVLAVALRVWRLGDWGFEGDEIYTLRDSLRPHFDNPRPLIYLLNYYVVRPLMPLDELGLRLLPALFGVLAIPALYLVGKRLIGTRGALLSSLLLTFSALHVYQSQYARYWSLVFLLSAVYPFAIYLGVRERDRGMLVLGLVTGVLAVLAHPVSILLVGGPGLLLVTRLRREHLARVWSQKTIRWVALLSLLVAAAVVIRFVPILLGWIGAHDAPHVADHLRDPRQPVVRQIAYLVAFAEGVTLPLVLAGALGFCLLWQERDRPLALFLASLSVFPVAFLTFLSFRTPVSVSYLLPAVPPLFIGAGVLLDRLAGIDWELRPRWLLPAMMVIVIIAAGAPTLVSQYRDGRRWDFRGVALWLEGRLTPEDVVFSDQAKVLDHYLSGSAVSPLVRDAGPLEQSARTLRESGRGGALWIVAPAPSHANRTNMRQTGLIGWIHDNCQLRNTVGVGRLDFRQQYLQVYRCPPAAAEGYGEVVGARASPLRDSTSR